MMTAAYHQLFDRINLLINPFKTRKAWFSRTRPFSFTRNTDLLLRAQVLLDPSGLTVRVPRHQELERIVKNAFLDGDFDVISIKPHVKGEAAEFAAGSFQHCRSQMPIIKQARGEMPFDHDCLNRNPSLFRDLSLNTAVCRFKLAQSVGGILGRKILPVEPNLAIINRDVHALLTPLKKNMACLSSDDI